METQNYDEIRAHLETNEGIGFEETEQKSRFTSADSSLARFIAHLTLFKSIGTKVDNITNDK